MNEKHFKTRIGEVRPTQLIYTYGVGSLIDLPKLSVIVMGLQDWPDNRPDMMKNINEPRLLQAIQHNYPTVRTLKSAPIARQNTFINPLDDDYLVGVPVAPFPRWLVCPVCHLLAPIASGLFKLHTDRYVTEKNYYFHENCTRANGKVEALPVRFLAACEHGHLDDFPWVDFVHRGKPCSKINWSLQLYEVGLSGEARDIQVECVCGEKRSMAEAFGKSHRDTLPKCKGRRPHLRDFDPEGCDLHLKPIVLGASNSWFPMIESVISIPFKGNELARLVEESWQDFQHVTSLEILSFMKTTGKLEGSINRYSLHEIYEEILKKSSMSTKTIVDVIDLKTPEYEVFSLQEPLNESPDFRLKEVEVPNEFNQYIEKLVLVERLREVQVMFGFTRLDSFGELLLDPDIQTEIPTSPLTNSDPSWLPASDVRGEGIFIQLKEETIQQWLNIPLVKAWEDNFFQAHIQWKKAHFSENPEEGFPGLRYILIHSLSHALMRQFSLECGYSAASIRERLYVAPASHEGGSMAGMLIYTASPDSEGTLGGLISLGETKTFLHHLHKALDSLRYCANDPLCAENEPTKDGRGIHAAACHACLFSPETSCERGNKYLDRSCLISTVEKSGLSFFEW